MKTHIYDSPIGSLQLEASAGRLTAVRFGVTQDFRKNRFSEPGDADRAVLDLTCDQLDEYFSGSRQSFNVPIALMGPAFQLRVWSALRGIRFGQTVSYGRLAKQLGDPAAARAVGAANAANPLPIILPCHRVIAADQTLSGYAGGVEAKRALLDHECADAALFATRLD